MPKRKTDEKNALRAAREVRGMSQEVAASKIGVARTMFSSWELQNREITLTQLAWMVQEFKLTEKEVLEILRWWHDAFQSMEPA